MTDEVKNELSEVKTEFVEVKTELSEVKTDLLEVKPDLLEVKTELFEVENEYNNDDKEKMLLVPRYELVTNYSGDNEPSVAKKPKLCLDWILVKRFDNCEQAEIALKSEGIWSLHYYHDTEYGKKKYYRCNKLKRRGPQCSAKMYLLFENTSDSVLMFKNKADHDHDEKKECSSLYGLSDAVKTEINKLSELKMKPKAILECLTKMENIKVPKMTQLRNYLNDQRRTISEQATISLGELEAWIRSHSELSLDVHEVFVVSYQIDHSDENNLTFRFVMSTKYLIDIAKNASVVHADTRYKMIWQGFSVLVCGTTDQNQKFHPLCLMVSKKEEKDDFKLMFQGLKDKIQEIFESSWNPKVFVCDAAESIQNAFLEVFGESVVVRICWAYAKRKIQERLRRIENMELRNIILNDVNTLHSITDNNIFDQASEAFLHKYEYQTEFVFYFKAQWLVQNRNWFLGVALNTPSTNSALESFTRVIKNSDTFRERFPLSRFLMAAKEIVNQWSTKYITNPEENYFAIIPSLTTKDWIDGCQWAKLPKEVSVVRIDDKYNSYQIPANQATECEFFNEQWQSFDDFKTQNFNKWTVLLPIEKDEWREGRCNCPAFFDFYKCKHVIGLAIRLGYTSPPPEAKNSAIAEKRKRGRPSKGQQALIIQ